MAEPFAAQAKESRLTPTAIWFRYAERISGAFYGHSPDIPRACGAAERKKEREGEVERKRERDGERGGERDSEGRGG